MRILLVEDDPILAATVASYLERTGLAVDLAYTGAAALVQAAVNPYDAIVLDLMLPDLDGVEVCRRLRERGNTTRILMATARDAVSNRIQGLEGGADDYLVKPYALEELLARIRALLRRPAESMPTVLEYEGLSLDVAGRFATRNGRRIELTTKEFAILEYLMRNPARVLTRSGISEHAWDEHYDPVSNVIDVYIARLRRKIDVRGEPPLLHTVRGAGYRLGQSAKPARR